jgi:transcription-repair coupling factor (superfamily II helicase)
MYCELLSDAVRKLKDEPVESIPTAVIDLGFATYIPKNYIPADRQRMDMYRKIAVARGTEDLKQIANELTDVYGAVPDEVELLLELAELRIAASKHDIKSIVTSGHDVVFSFAEKASAKAKSLFANTKGKIRTPDPKTVYLRLAASYFEPKTLMTVLRKILNR